MTLPAISEIIRDTGLLSFDGTPLGYAQSGVILSPNYTITPVFSEDSGLIPQFFIYSGMSCILKFSNISFNDKAFKVGFIQRVDNAYPSLTIPSTTKTGEIVSTTCKGTFLYTPSNPAHPKITSSDCFGFMVGDIAFSYKNLATLPLYIFCKEIKIAAQ